MPLRTLLAAALGFCVLTSAVADDERRYDVEIVILENTDTRAGEAERWRPEVVVPDIEGAIAPPGRDSGEEDMEPAVRAALLAETPEGFEPLPAEQRQLGGAIDKLRESGRYRVLRHLAWRQPALDGDSAPRIRVRTGEPITVRVPIRDFEELDALEAAAAGDGEDGSTEQSTGDDEGDDRAITFGADRSDNAVIQPLLRPIEVYPLDGTLRLVVSRYLHIRTDLYLTVPVEWSELTQAADPDTGENGNDDASLADEPVTGRDSAVEPERIARGPDGQAMLSYPFVQRRRMRSGELHYLDHPVLGLLIRVDRVEEKAGGDDPETAGDGGEAAR